MLAQVDDLKNRSPPSKQLFLVPKTKNQHDSTIIFTLKQLDFYAVGDCSSSLQCSSSHLPKTILAMATTTSMEIAKKNENFESSNMIASMLSMLWCWTISMLAIILTTSNLSSSFELLSPYSQKILKSLAQKDKYWQDGNDCSNKMKSSQK